MANNSWQKNFWQYQPGYVQDRNQLVAAGKKGGRASALKVQQRQILREVLALPLDEQEELAQELKSRGMPNNIAYAANLAVAKRAMKGDVEAIKYIRDTIGEKPKDTTQMEVTDARAWNLAELSDAQLVELADKEDDTLSLPPGVVENTVAVLEERMIPIKEAENV